MTESSAKRRRAVGVALCAWLVFTLCLFPTVLSHDDDLDDDFDDGIVSEEVEQPPIVEEDDQYNSPSLDPKRFHFAEHFDDLNKFNSRWILSKAKKDGADEQIAKYDGEWKVEAPQRTIHKGDLGLVLKSKVKHAAISSRLDKPFVFADKPLVVQYEVTMQEGQECGGAYIKLLSSGKETDNLAQFHDKTPYTIMFGPDKCGNDHKLHFIFKHKNPLNGSLEEKHCKKPNDRLEEPFKDKKPHLYTLIVRPDNSFSVLLDNKEINSGSLLEDFTPPVNPPELINDPNDFKPADWDDKEKIPDPAAVKPEDWDDNAPPQIPDPQAVKPDGWLDDEPEMIPDPDSEKPSDWDLEMDGEWEAQLIDNPICAEAPGCGKWSPPLITNPNYKGIWKAPLINNPNYQGKWTPKKIPNPHYFKDENPFKMTSISAVGIELWSMSPSLLFDNIIITDDEDSASLWARETFVLKMKKLDRDSVTMWGRIMKALNYKPEWWALYFVYCSIPASIYVWYLRKRVKEESVLDWAIKTTNEYPWLWAVYLLIVGFVLCVIFYLLCGPSSPPENDELKEKARIAEAKKTDAMIEGDQPVENEDEVEAVSGDDEEEEDDEGEGEVEEEEEAPASTKESLETPIPNINENSGDMPRRRKPRKE